MAWQVPWIVAWFISWAGPYTSPPLLSNDAQPDALILGGVPFDTLISDEPSPIQLVIENSCISPDGFPRSAVLAGIQGGTPTLPGPVISGNKTDRFLINVTNSLTDETMFTGTTIHWHGIHQNSSSQMDGVEGTTQCVMAPQHSFLYNFTAQDQVGTFWYHSHYAVQYCDGLRGPFIIYDHDNDMQNYNYDVDDETTIITLMDWYHYPSVLTPRQVWPDSVLINGLGCYPGMVSCPLPHTFTVQYGKRYRFRLLNMACKAYYNFSIEGHNLTVIEVEGAYVEPYTVGSINIFAAQRYSFILDANQTPCNYTIYADPSPATNSTSNTTLVYENAPLGCVPSSLTLAGPLNEGCLRGNFTPDNLLGPSDLSYVIDISKNESNYNFLVDGVQFTSPTVPVLLQIMSGWMPGELEPNKSVVPLGLGNVVEIVFDIDADGQPHPFHLHGHSFAVVKSADGLCPGGSPGNPVMRDTIDTGINYAATNGVTIRFFTDNPGPWILHCHNEWHLWTGMALVFAEGCTSDNCTAITSKQAYDSELKSFCRDIPQYFSLPPVNTIPGPGTPGPTCSPVSGS